MSQLPTGVAAPHFQLKSIKVLERTLSEALTRGPVVLAFYKASCPTCQLTFPYLQKIHSELGAGSAFTIWGISQDEAGETKEFSERFKIKFDLLIDEHPYEVSSAYGLEFVPGIFVIGEDGRIALSDFGFSKATLNQIACLAAAGSSRSTPALFDANDGLPATRPG